MEDSRIRRTVPKQQLEFTTTPIGRDELPAMVRYILPNHQATTIAAQSQANEYVADLQRGAGEWVGHATRGDRQIAGACLAACLPGGTAVVMPAAGGLPGISQAAQIAAGRETLRAIAARGTLYAQGLLETADTPREDVLRALNFRAITTLNYLERATTFPFVEENFATALTFTQYQPALHDQFLDVTRDTYADSLDCPEINGLRPIEDVLATHRASGEFDPARWLLATIENQPAGCILLGAHPRRGFAEITYMGVVPAFRGRGLGKVLLRKGLIVCRRAGLERLVLVVDERNTPAQRMYAASGFEPFAARRAYVHVFARDA